MPHLAKASSTRKRRLAIGAMVAALIGFVTSNELKNQYRCLEGRLSQTSTEPYQVELEPLAAHTIFVWAVDEESGYTWASLDATVTIHDSSGALIDQHQLVASEDNDDGGIKRAQHGFTTKLPAGPESILVDVKLTSGDYVDIAVYADLPSWLNIAPGICILLGIVGLVMLLRSRQT